MSFHLKIPWKAHSYWQHSSYKLSSELDRAYNLLTEETTIRVNLSLSLESMLISRAHLAPPFDSDVGNRDL